MQRGFVPDFEIYSLFILISIYIYAHTKYSLKTESNRAYVRMLRAAFLGTVSDILSTWSIEAQLSRTAIMLSTTAFFAFSIYTIYCFMRYMVSYADISARSRLIIARIDIAVIGSYGLLLVINNATGFMFYYNRESGYGRNPGFFLIFAFIFAFVIEGFLFLFKSRKRYSRARVGYFAVILMAVFLSPLVQYLLFPYYLLNYFFVSVGILAMLIFIETPDEQNLRSTLIKLDHLKSDLQLRVEEKTKEVLVREDKLRNLTAQLMFVMTKAIDAKDRYTSGHSERVALYSRELAKKAGLSEEKQRQLYTMGILHDVGKVGIPNHIINKPGKLTDEEFDIMRSHTKKGSEILTKIRMFPTISKGARWHHERIDGKGYPDRLTGDQIPEEIKIISVADAYDAMTSYRSYRGALPQEEVRRQILEGKGSQFDPYYADLMIEIIDEDSEYRLHEFRGNGESL